MSIAPGILNLTFPQGATWDLSITYTDADGDPIDLSNHSARMQVRQSYTSTDTVLDLSSGSGITLGGSAGTIDITVPAATTVGVAPLRYVYDLEVDVSSVVTR